MISRRRFLALVGIGASASLAAACAPVSPTGQPVATPAGAGKPAAAPKAAAPTVQAPASNQLVVNGYGGEYEDLFKRIIQEPFERKHNAKITYDSSGSAAEDYAKIRASGGDPGWDVVSATAQEPVQGAREGLLAEITEDKVPNLKFAYQKTRDMVGKYGVSHEIQYMSLMYHKDRVTPRPDSWSVMWDPKYKGHVLLFDPANIIGVYHLAVAARINGGGWDNLEPGFKALESIKPNLLATPTASTEAVPYMERGDVWLMPYWDGRAHFYRNQGLPYDFTIPKEGSVPLVNALIIPKGAKNKDLAYQFVDFWLSKEIQREWALGYTVGPGRPDVDLPADFRAGHITSVEEMEKMLPVDYEFIAKNRPQWVERWRKVMAS